MWGCVFIDVWYCSNIKRCNVEVMKHFAIVISVGIMTRSFHPLWPTNARGVQVALTGEKGAAATKDRRCNDGASTCVCLSCGVLFSSVNYVPPTCPNSHFRWLAWARVRAPFSFKRNAIEACSSGLHEIAGALHWPWQEEWGADWENKTATVPGHLTPLQGAVVDSRLDSNKRLDAPDVTGFKCSQHSLHMYNHFPGWPAIKPSRPG